VGTDLARGTLRVLVGIGPFCAVLGFLTPMLMDGYSRGDPERAGRAYALNTLGCILGPLLSGFILLPLLGERMTLVALAAPFYVFALMATLDAWPSVPNLDRAALWTALFVTAFGGGVLALRTKDFETLYRQRVVRRDHTATVIAVLGPGPRQLLVNGVGITSLTPVTKMMVHLPMALLDRPATKGLVLCFGMGTSFRSMRTWGVPATAVELVPSVPRLFGLFHADADEILAAPGAAVLIDDARRYLERSDERYDLIVVDPPPRVEAAGSSLLYSREFCEIARRRLKPGGILQNWLPEGEGEVIGAVARALAETFPEVRVFRSVEGWGFHFLASDSPLPRRSARELAGRLPTAAASDLVEWDVARSAEEQFRIVLDREVPLSLLTPLGEDRRALSDDRPVNEYYMLRRLLHAPKVYSSMDPFPSPGLP
jgi:predicted membrane-bound spermidine synthase